MPADSWNPGNRQADDRFGWSQQSPASGPQYPSGSYGSGNYGSRPASGGARGWQDLPQSPRNQPPTSTSGGDGTTAPQWGAPGYQAPGGNQTSGGFEQSDGYRQVAPAPAFGDVLVARPSRRSRHKGGAFGALALAIVLVGGGAGTSMILAGGGGGGASSPTAAVQDFLNALDNSDVIGMMDDLAPGERAALAPGLEDIFAQLKRIGVFSSEADLHDITGISMAQTGYQLSAQQLSPEVAAVTITGDSGTSSLDPNKLPLGSYFKSLAIAGTTGQVQTGDAGISDGFLFGTTQANGKWYVSLGYSLAFEALHGANEPLTLPADAIVPAGASSPKEAVQQLFSSAANLDLRGFLADLDPGELAALDSYAPLFLGQAQSALDSVKSQVSISFTMPSMTTEQISSGTLVKFGPGFAFHFSDPQLGVSEDYSGGCLTIKDQGATQHECQSPDGASQAEQALLTSLPPAVQPILQRFISSPPNVGIVTSNVDGSWYVSPTRTYLQAINAVLGDLQPNDIQTIIANASGIGQAVTSYAENQASKQLGANGFGSLSSTPLNDFATLNATAAESSAANAAAEANAVNAATNEIAYYASNMRYTSNGVALDPNMPWSAKPAPGHVTASAGCDNKAGMPSSFHAGTTCGAPADAALMIQSESTQGRCFVVFQDSGGASGQQETWYGYRPSCSFAMPSGPPTTGRAAKHLTGWYTFF